MIKDKSIVEYLEEFVLNQQGDDPKAKTVDINKQVNATPTTTDRSDARTIVISVRGVPVGKFVDFSAEKNVRDVSNTPKEKQSLILKNDIDELVYVTKVDEMLVYTSISKKRLIKRETILAPRALQFLKRFLVQL